MPDYSKGKIYRIVCNTTGNVYFGSTSQDYLSQRLRKHVEEYNKYKEGKKNSGITSIQIIENGNYEIVLVEKYPCSSKEELHARERYYIENNDCVNKVIPTRTPKEYRQDNKDIISERKKVYYYENHEAILENKKGYKFNNRDAILEKNIIIVIKIKSMNITKTIKKQRRKNQKYIGK